MAGDEAAVGLVALAAVDAAHHDTIGDQRPGRVRVTLAVVSFHAAPQLFAGACIDRDQCCVIGREKYLVAVQRNVLGWAAQRARLSGIVVDVLPDHFTVGSVDGLHHIAWVSEEHHAIVDERRDLVAAFAHRERPGQPQLAHVACVNLLERAVALTILCPAPA